MHEPARSPRRALVPGWTLVKVSFRLTLMLMTASLFLPVTARSPDGLDAVGFGRPIPFVEQDVRPRAPSTYPARIRMGDPRAQPTTLRPVAAVADVTLLMFGVVLIARMLGTGWRARD